MSANETPNNMAGYKVSVLYSDWNSFRSDSDFRALVILSGWSGRCCVLDHNISTRCH